MNPILKTCLSAGACSVLLALGAWSAPSVAAASPDATAAEAPAQPGQMKVLPVTGDDVAGTLATASGALSFRTASLAAGKAAAQGVSPDRVTVRLEVNGAVIDHDLDYVAGTMTVRTAERVTIDEQDRAVLRSFQIELGRTLPTLANGQRVPKSHDVLWRLAEMYSEVPLGRTFAPEWVVKRSNAMPLAPQAGGFDRETGVLLPGAPILNRQPIMAAAACNEQSGGSFTNLHAIVDVCDDDRVFYRSSSHDYCPTHGYSSKSVAYGCGASSCPGRCGAGCGVGDGLGAWYQDCLDHDICNRDHDSQLGACGDEWTEAADDYAFGAISCYTTCH